MGLGGVLRMLTLLRDSWIEEGGEEWMLLQVIIGCLLLVKLWFCHVCCEFAGS